VDHVAAMAAIHGPEEKKTAASVQFKLPVNHATPTAHLARWIQLLQRLVIVQRSEEF